MNGKKSFYRVINVFIKIIVYTLIIFFIYKGAVYAYDFGFSVFSAKPIDEEPGKDVTITIAEDTSSYKIGEILESNGLIRDARVFWVQEMLSEEHGKLNPGIYTLNTSMTVQDMIQAMSPDEETSEE